MVTPAQIARATLSNPDAAAYLALTYRKLTAWRKAGQLSEARAIRLLRNNARDGRRVLGQRLDDSATLDQAARLLYIHWRDSSDTE